MKKNFLTFAFGLIFMCATFFSLSACGEKQVTDAVVDTTDAKITYSYGESFDSTGLAVDLTYNDNSTSTIAYANFTANKITIDSSAFVSTTAGTYAIYVIYDNSATIRDSYNVTVANPTENGFYIDTTSVKETYAVGENLDLSNLKVYQIFEENTATLENREIALSVAENDGGYTVDSSFYNKNLGGVYAITINYGSYTAQSFHVTVENELQSLSITAPTKTTYAYGEALDLAGLVVTLNYNDTTTENIIQGTGSNEYSLSGYSATTVGTQTIVVTYNGDTNKTETFEVTVSEPTESGFTIDTTNAKTTYAVDDDLDLSGLKVYKTFVESVATLEKREIALSATENDGGYTVNSSTYNESLGGTYTITISYGSYTAQTFDVTVVKALTGIEVDTSSAAFHSTVAYNTSLEVIKSGLVVTKIYDDGTSETIEEGTTGNTYSLSTTYDLGEYGLKTITVIYNADNTKTTSFDVTISEPELIGITLDTSNIVTKFVVNSESSPDLTQLVVYKSFALYNGDPVTVPEKSKNSSTGEYLISTDEGYTDGYEVSVNARSYNGDVEVLTPITYSPSSTGTYVYKVAYGTFYQTFDVNIVVIATSIAEDVATTTFPKIYAYGADISNSISKLAVLAYRGESDTTGDNIPLGTIGESFSVNYSAFNGTTAGTYDIIVTYNNNTAVTFTIQVTVQTAEPTSISLNRESIPTTVVRGTGETQTWSFDALIVTLTYADSTTEILANSSSGYYLDLGGYDINTVGTYTITISYNGVASKTFEITVTQGENDFLWYTLDSSHRVIFKGITYTFDSPFSNVHVYSGDDSTGTLVQIIQTGGSLIDLPVGDYYFTYDYGSSYYTMHYKLVNYVNYFDYGTDYTLNQSTISDLGTTDSSYISGTSEYICLVGTGSQYYFDIKVKELGVSSANATSDIVDYTFTKRDEVAQDWIEVDSSLITMDGYKMTFDESLIGETIKCEASLKYQNRTINDATSSPLKVLTYVFVLNNGYNVFNDADMEVAFGNRSVQTINIQRNIAVALSADQYNADGSIRNVYAGEILPYLDYDEDGNIVNNRSGNAYVRAGYGINGDDLVINGNYFNIDASGLDLLTLTGIYANQPTEFLNPNGTTEGRAINAQSAIFAIQTVAQATDAERTAYLDSEPTAEDLQTAISNKVTFNNLTIIGNTQTPTGDATNEEQIAVAIANSGGYSGIRSADADIITNNINIRFTTIGLYATSIPTDIYATDTEITECWANNLYVWAGGLTKLTNCDFSYAGGGSVWIEDHDIRLGIFNPSFEMDADTEINNWVSGTEAWFVVHSMSLLATGIKSQLDSAINSSLGKTIIKLETNATTGQQFELFNFAVVLATFPKTVDLQTTYGAGYASTTPVIGFNIDGISVERTFAEALETMGLPLGIEEKITELCTATGNTIANHAVILSYIANQINAGAGETVIAAAGVGAALLDENNALHSTCVSALSSIAQGYTAVDALLKGYVEQNFSSNANYETLLPIVRKVISGTNFANLTTTEQAYYEGLVTGMVNNFVTATASTASAVNAMLNSIYNTNTYVYTEETLRTYIVTCIKNGTVDETYDATILTILSTLLTSYESDFAKYAKYITGVLTGYGITVLMAPKTTNYIEINQAFGDYSNLTLITEFFDEE